VGSAVLTPGENTGIFCLPPMIKFGKFGFKFGFRGAKLVGGDEDHMRRGEECMTLSSYKIEVIFYASLQFLLTYFNFMCTLNPMMYTHMPKVQISPIFLGGIRKN